LRVDKKGVKMMLKGGIIEGGVKTEGLIVGEAQD